jgi:tryptophan-rich sensory protein
MKGFFKLTASIAICEVVGIAGSVFTASSVAIWYNTLNKPLFSPPNWIFGPVWAVLYLLMGVSLYLVWSKGFGSKKGKAALNFFIAQLFLNFLWSILFFGFHSPILALVDIAALWIMILLTIVKFLPISKTAAYLLIPYLLWVSFASLLNLSILMLN